MATPPKEITNESDNMDTDMETTLSISALEGEWQVVVDMYRNHKAAHTMKIIGGRGTALHVAVNDGQEDVVKDLLESITGEGEQLQVLQKTDEREDTPLHLAASKGFKAICKLIIEGPNENKERNKLVAIKNDLGETPLFLAALTWQKQAFAYLFYVFQNHVNSEANQTYKDVIDLQVLVRNDGDTILHSAIRREFFGLAVIIIHYCPKLHEIPNKKGFTPLKLLASTPSAFWSASKLSWWRRIIYHCIEVGYLDVQGTLERYLNDERRDPELKRLPPNYLTCYEFFTMSEFAGLGGCGILPSKKKNRQRSATDEHFISMPLPDLDSEASHSHSPERKSKKSLVPEMQFKEVNVLPPNYVTFERFVKFAYMLTLGLHGAGVRVIRKIKKKHTRARQLLSALMQNPSQAYTGSGGQPVEQLLEDNDEDEDENPSSDPFSAYNHHQKDKEAMKMKQNQASEEKNPEAEDNIDRKETALLTAAKHGIVEIVKVILSRIPSALHDTTSDKKNVFLVAIKYRQPLVVRALLGLDNLSEQKKKTCFKQ